MLPVIASRDPAFASVLVDTLEGGFARTRSPTVASPRSCFFDGVWICSQGRHAGGVDRNLDPSPERQAVSLDAAVIVSAGCDIEVLHQDVGCNSSTSFTADTSGSTLERSTSACESSRAAAGDQAREGSSGSRTRPRPWKQDAAIHVWCRAGVLRPQRQGSEPASLTARARQVVPRSCYFPPAPCPLPCPVCTSTTTECMHICLRASMVRPARRCRCPRLRDQPPFPAALWCSQCRRRSSAPQ